MEEQPQLWQSVADPLPSDSRFRLDLATLLANDLLGAQVRKQRFMAKVLPSVPERMFLNACFPLPRHPILVGMFGAHMKGSSRHLSWQVYDPKLKWNHGVCVVNIARIGLTLPACNTLQYWLRRAGLHVCLTEVHV